ncbi:MAG: class I adenylate-forming enzyme family protein [Myxococcota bacterium]
MDAGLALQPDARRLTLPRFVEDVAARHGARPALRDDTGAALRFDELLAGARAVARGLVAAGVAKGERIGVLLPSSCAWATVAFGAATAGGVVVPLSTFATADELDFVLAHGDVATLVLAPEFLSHRFLDDLLARHPAIAEGAPGAVACAALPALRRVIATDLDARRGAVVPLGDVVRAGARVDDALLDALVASVDPGDDGMLIYTSGTSARPKGVLHRQRAPVIQSFRFAEYMALAPSDRVLSVQPFFWTAGIAMSLGASLASGAELLVHARFRAEEMLEAVERERPTALHAWPHQEKEMAEHPTARARDLTSLRKVEFANALAPLAGLERDEWGTYGSYGLSETFTICTALPAWAPAADRAATSGEPLPGMEVRIVDPESGAPLPRGAKGEIAVRGLTLMRGYARVAPELVFDADGFFRTQDGGFLDEAGRLHWTGRLSSLVKTGGANVSPLEVEAAVDRFPGLVATVAVGVPHPTLGEALVLCAVVAPGAAAPDEGAVVAALRARVAVYKVPRRVLFFGEAEAPRTGTQKLRADAFRELARARLEAERAEIAGHVYGA